jgi:hypothetical protein
MISVPLIIILKIVLDPKSGSLGFSVKGRFTTAIPEGPKELGIFYLVGLFFNTLISGTLRCF